MFDLISILTDLAQNFFLLWLIWRLIDLSGPIGNNQRNMFFLYIAVMEKHSLEYTKTGKWHCDCPCNECKVIQAWKEIPFWKQLKIKIHS